MKTPCQQRVLPGQSSFGKLRVSLFLDPNTHTVSTLVWGWSPSLTRPLVPNAGAWRDNAFLSLTLCLWGGTCPTPAEKCLRVLLSLGSSSPSRMQPTVYSVTQIIFSTCSVLLSFLVITEKQNRQCCIWSGPMSYDQRMRKITPFLPLPFFLTLPYPSLPTINHKVSGSSSCFCTAGKWEKSYDCLRLIK